MDWLIALGLIAGGYLLGSIPTAYLLAKAIKGIDLRRYGSGTVSGSMVWEHVARWAVFPVALFDIAKAALPAWLALQLGQGNLISIASGLSAVIGHNWPVYLKFHGGRGFSTMGGVMLVHFPAGFLWALGFMLISRISDPPVCALLGLVTIPLLGLVIEAPGYLTLLVGVLTAVTLLKRLEANGRPLPPRGPERRRVLLRRLLLDRDIRDHEEWIRRTPSTQE